jgi:mRNA interferase RelE/StbE
MNWRSTIDRPSACHFSEYAANPAAHANNVTRLVGSPASRMRVADYRVIFVETEQELVVTRVGPRGNVYD